MTAYPPYPRPLKGAIVALNLPLPIPLALIPFQYNPESLSRTLQVQAVNEGGNRAEVLRLEGAPVETIKLDVEIDATDQLAESKDIAVSLGIYPKLSALETLIYPSSIRVVKNMIRARLGTLEIIPPAAPLTLLIWGVKRIVPIRLTDFSITEEAYDTNLNPIRAKVSLSIRILNYDDFPGNHPGSSLFLIHHQLKEVMASLSLLT